MQTWILNVSGRTSVTSENAKMLMKNLISLGYSCYMLVEHRHELLKNENPDLQILKWPSTNFNSIENYKFVNSLIKQTKPVGIIAKFSGITPLIGLGWWQKVPIRIAWHHTLSSAWRINSNYSSWATSALIARRKITIKLATHVIANSSASQDDLVRNLGMKSERVVKFLNSIADPQGWIPTQEKVANRIMCVGIMNPAKGQDILLQASALLKDLEFEIEFIGDGPVFENIKNLAHQLGLEDRCRFFGALTNRETLKRVSNGCISVLPSRSEAFGLVLVEAMALGLPVVASNIGGIPEVVEDQVTGLLFATGDVVELASKLRILLTNQRIGTEMGLAGRKRYLEFFESSRAISQQSLWLDTLAQQYR